MPLKKSFMIFLIISLSFSSPLWGQDEKAYDLVEKGNQFYLDGKFEEALEAYQAGLEGEMDAPATQAKIYYNIGNTYYRMEQYVDAVTAYQEALRLQPDDLDTKFNLEMALRALEGKLGVLKGVTEVAQPLPQDPLDQEIQMILQQLEQKEFRNPSGVPQPPQPRDHSTPYKKDW